VWDLQTRPPCPVYANKGSHQSRKPIQANALTSHSHPCDSLSGTESITRPAKHP